MRIKVIALALLLGACATPQSGPPANFDPAACYERTFSIYFDEHEDRLNEAARSAIDAVQSSLRGCRIDAVRILGLSEAAGASEANLDLSARRAFYVAEYLGREPGWPRHDFDVLAAGEAGAISDEGQNRPMRRVARITVQASALEMQ